MVPRGPDRASFLTELRARGVIGVAVVYGVVGWTVVEVASAVFPALGLPDWSVTLVVALVLLGFPMALVLAWAFERTPSGVQRAAPSSGKRTAAAFVLGLALMAVLAFLLGDDASTDASPEDRPSLAVLPFEDLSPGDQSYFSEGIAEELMAVLSTVPELEVVGRSSAFAFRDRDASLEEIGAELGVDVVLDGSVRRDGDDLRISVQLIDVESERVLWSRRYDREAGDIFALQDEIAAAVAGEVDIRLSLPPPPEADDARLRAHDLYLRGLAAWHRRTSADIEEAVRLFERAVAADSSYAPAHAGVALAHSLYPIFARDDRDHAALALQAARRALALDSTLAEAHAALSQRALVLTWDRSTAVAEARRAIELRPSYATAWQWYGETLLAQGRTTEALEAMERAIELDPLAPVPRNVRAGILFSAGDTAAALAQIRAGLERWPDVLVLQMNLLGIALCTADTLLIQEAAELLGPAFPGGPGILPTLLAPAREPPGPARTRLLEEYLATIPPAEGSYPAGYAAGLGEYDVALRVLERTIDAGEDPSLLYILPAPCFDPIRGTPRFEALMARLP